MAANGAVPVRCPNPECGWTGKRKSDQELNAEHEKGCPKCEGKVLIGGPPPTFTQETPSGIEIAFWGDKNIETGRDQRQKYLVNGEKYDRVSTVSGIYDKPGLTPAAVKLTEEGVIELAKSGVNLAGLTQGQLRSLMYERGLHYDSVWEEARIRGELTHGMLLPLFRDGVVPKLSDYDEAVRPWIQGGLKFGVDFKLEVLMTEYLVASPTLKVAGRGDLVARVLMAPERYRHLIGLVLRADYKTVTAWKYDERKDGPKLRPPWDENIIQIDGYESCATESGYDAADRGAVIRFGPDGEYDVHDFPLHEDAFTAAHMAFTEKRERQKAPKPEPEAVAA